MLIESPQRERDLWGLKVGNSMLLWTENHGWNRGTWGQREELVRHESCDKEVTSTSHCESQLLVGGTFFPILERWECPLYTLKENNHGWSST